MTLPVENVFFQQQQSTFNLTTFDVYPFPSRLRVIPYPLDSRGVPIAPEYLFMHSKRYRFPWPKCFHGQRSKLTTTENNDGKATTRLICGATGYQVSTCSFMLDLNKLLSNGNPLTCARYRTIIGESSALVSEYSYLVPNLRTHHLAEVSAPVRNQPRRTLSSWLSDPDTRNLYLDDGGFAHSFSSECSQCLDNVCDSTFSDFSTDDDMPALITAEPSPTTSSQCSDDTTDSDYTDLSSDSRIPVFTNISNDVSGVVSQSQDLNLTTDGENNGPSIRSNLTTLTEDLNVPEMVYVEPVIEMHSLSLADISDHAYTELASDAEIPHSPQPVNLQEQGQLHCSSFLRRTKSDIGHSSQ